MGKHVIRLLKQRILQPPGLIKESLTQLGRLWVEVRQDGRRTSVMQHSQWLNPNDLVKKQKNKITAEMQNSTERGCVLQDIRTRQD